MIGIVGMLSMKDVVVDLDLIGLRGDDVVLKCVFCVSCMEGYLFSEYCGECVWWGVEFLF